MISFNELKKGARIIIEDQPYEIIESSFLFKGRGHSVCQAKIQNIINNNIITKTFRPSDSYPEAEILKIEVKFLYAHRDNYFFEKEDGRFSLTSQQIGESSQYLKPNQIIEGLIFNNEIINISLPIKVELEVIEAPPGVKGDRSQAGTKIVTLETGSKIAVPLFIKEKDVIEINTKDHRYIQRIEKN